MLKNLVQKIRQKMKGSEQMAKIISSDLMAQNLRKLFKSKTRIASFVGFTGSYWFLLNKLRQSDYEIYRLAGAGSLMVNIVETSFFCLDTINSRSKVCEESISFIKLLNNTLK
jgi:hypothetical protein